MSETGSIFSGMSAETGYEEVVTPPLRVSGFISLLLALVGVLAFYVPTLVLLPLAAIGFGLFGLRRFSGPVPMGYNVAALGLILGIFFASGGFFVYFLKNMSLAEQAEYFARQYVELIANGESELAMELEKTPGNRFLSDMSLKEYYDNSEKEMEAKLLKNPDLLDGYTSRASFMNKSVNKRFYEAGPGAEWELDQAVRVYQRYGYTRAEVILTRPFNGKPFRAVVTLEYYIDEDTGDYQWFLDTCKPFTERIVAERVM